MLLITLKVMTKRAVFLLAVAPVLPSLSLTYLQNHESPSSFYSSCFSWNELGCFQWELYLKSMLTATSVNFSVFSVWISLSISLFICSVNEENNGIWVLVSLCCGWWWKIVSIWTHDFRTSIPRWPGKASMLVAFGASDKIMHWHFVREDWAVLFSLVYFALHFLLLNSLL